MNEKKQININWLTIILLVYAVIATITILVFDGTGDSGDSVLHYLFSKYAPTHPELFFDHWAKPFFVLVTSSFAQFGFVGMKVFNTLTVALSIFFTYRSIEKMQLKNPVVGTIILITIPLYYVLTFSGLTEPLFALMSVAGLYFILREKPVLASLIISFLPFVRSEGLIIIGVFAFYFLIKKQWKFILSLGIGHLVYSIAGYFVFNDFLWIFNKIPYAKLSSTYGAGTLTHFIEQMYYVVGLPIYLLFIIGTISIIWKFIQRRINWELHIVVFLGFFGFFVAHSLFWYLGIFNSMGLNRVLIGLAPFIAIISLFGFNMLTTEILKRKQIRLAVQSLLIALILIFPLVGSPASIKFDQTMVLSPEQRCANKAAMFVKSKIDGNKLIYAPPYISEVLDIDHFNQKERLSMQQNLEEISQAGDLVIWENWFSIVEHGVDRTQLDTSPNFKKLKEYISSDRGREIVYVVYERI